MVTIGPLSAARTGSAITAAIPLLLFGAGTAAADPHPCDPITGLNCTVVPGDSFVISDGPTYPGMAPVIIEDPGIPGAPPPEVSWENCELLMHLTNYMCGSGPAQSNPPH
jgi:hypothetical protein